MVTIERCVDDHEEKEDVSNNDDEDGIDEKLWAPDTECKGGDIRALLHEGAQREPERVQERVLVLVPGIQDEAGDKMMMIGAMKIRYHDNDHGIDDNDEKRVLVLVPGKYPSRKEGGRNDDG